MQEFSTRREQKLPSPLRSGASPPKPAAVTSCAAMPQRTESSAFAPSSAAVIASYMASVSAFFLEGRFIRMVRMPSASVTITCSVIKCIRFPLHQPQPGERQDGDIACCLFRKLESLVSMGEARQGSSDPCTRAWGGHRLSPLCASCPMVARPRVNRI